MAGLAAPGTVGVAMDVPLSCPDVVLTHESDLDGFVSGHLLQRLAQLLFKKEVRLEAWNTQAWKQRPLKEKCAWVSDMAFDARMDRPGWVVFDHHPVECTVRNARLVHDTSRSAARICYDFAGPHGIANTELDRLVHLTDVGDLFVESSPDFIESQEYSALLKSYSFWNLNKLTGGRIEALLNSPLLEVIRVKKRIEDPMGLEWSRKHMTSITPELGWVDVVVGNANLIVHELLREGCSPHPVLATMMRKAATGIVLSLRSRNGEALAIAQKLQGGGHPNAAGATLPRGVQSIPDAIDYLRKVLSSRLPDTASLESSLEGLGR